MVDIQGRSNGKVLSVCLRRLKKFVYQRDVCLWHNVGWTIFNTVCRAFISVFNVYLLDRENHFHSIVRLQSFDIPSAKL